MLAQVLVSSVTAGAVYALIALGFVLIHKGTGVVHFGYGDQVMFGAYLVLIGQVVLGLPFWPAVASALMLSALLGAVIYGGFMWPLRNASLLARIIASLALGTVLREFVRAYMGPNAWPFPFLLSQTAVSVADVLVVPANLAIVGCIARRSRLAVPVVRKDHLWQGDHGCLRQPGRCKHRRGPGLHRLSRDLDPGIGARHPRGHSGRAASYVIA